MPPTVLFDLDDTLTDANGFASEALSAAAQLHGHALAADRVSIHPGAPYVPLLQQELGVALEAAEAIYATYVARYRDTMADALRERAGASEVLRAVAEQGARVGLVTNKLEVLAREIVSQFGWAPLFGAIVGQDTCAFRKPDPGVIHHALGLLAGRIGEVAFVGDTAGDMRCARDAGVGTVIGLLGTTPAASLIEAGATRICADLAEVRAILVR